MPPTDASADTGTTPPATVLAPDTGTGVDAAMTDRGPAPSTGEATGRTGTGTDTGRAARADGEDALDLRLPDAPAALFTQAGAGTDGARRNGSAAEWPACAARTCAGPAGGDLLDRVAGWGPADTPAGVFRLVPVRLERDLPLVGRWMNDPAVAAFWELSGPQDVTEDHLRAQLAGDGRSVPCIGVLDGAPMSYWEIYRADLDPLARHYPARPHDTGVHLLLGAAGDRGRGLGGTLLGSVADLVLRRRPACARVVAEPDLRNTPCVAAFLKAGFRFSAEVALPAKRAALMVRDRSLRTLP
ncbi:GNAT family N-acetyltransferase [Streptomyces sp. NPDC052701]|uniref:GNAT family N-acetyltransferase n=1 Tax=Streptomyces sp. NPDC052701 TaxID=3155533 RepID=UPI00344A29B6